MFQDLMNRISYVQRVELVVILGVVLLLLYIFYSLRLIGPKKH